jgi:undecaprenyl-diphosphatase
MDIAKSLLFGILEGITEWLPVSSTGHLILLERILTLRVGTDDRFTALFSELFQVLIQLGAIGACAIRCFDRLFPRACGAAICERRSALSLYGKLVLSGIPAALLGIVGDRVLTHFMGKDIDGLLYRASTVALMLIVYGILFLIPEERLPILGDRVSDVASISAPKALAIGCFQALSIIPGTSRSGSTILGGMLLGLDRRTAAEYSFLLAIPTMTGASLLKVLKFASAISALSLEVPREAYILLFTGMLSAFLVSLVMIDFLLDFVKKHTFRGFGIYRVLLGCAVLLLSAV